MSTAHKLKQDDVLVSNLRSLMHKKHINEAELSRQTQIPQATLHKILSGKTSDPRASTLKTLADFFDITIDTLISDEPYAFPDATLSQSAQSVPVISWTECMNAKTLLAQINPTNWEDWRVTAYLGENIFALMSKPAMEPRFPKGTFLFIDPNAKPQDGDYVVVLYPGTEEATLREFSVDGPSQILLPMNPNAKPNEMDESIQIVGVLVKSSFSY